MTRSYLFLLCVELETLLQGGSRWFLLRLSDLVHTRVLLNSVLVINNQPTHNTGAKCHSPT